MIYQPKYFKARELLDRETFEKFGEAGLRYFRPEILKALDWVRENYPTKTGKRALTVNNWASFAGPYQWRGLRGPACPEYKRHSGHSFGAAVDFSAEGATPEEVRKWILEEHSAALQLQDHLNGSLAGFVNEPVLFIRRMELGTPTWVHIDCLEHDGSGILLVNP